MAGPGHDKAPQLSVLDRLLVDKTVGEVGSESNRPVLAQLKGTLRRDLEWLLNTKQLADGIPPGSPHLLKSLLAYGLPDLTAISLDNVQDQDRVRRAVTDAIARFEPRLADVRITLEAGREAERSLRFRIDAMLLVEPEPEPVSFDSVLDLGSKMFRVQGDGG